MKAERPAKGAMRGLWMEVATAYYQRFAEEKGPLYLTLSGGEGHEIRQLVEEGVITLTEVGGISVESQDKIVAVENSLIAVGTLQARFPGLKILRVDVKSLVR